MENLINTLDTDTQLRHTKEAVKELQEENAMLLSALKDAYKCSGERNHLTKPVLDTMLEAINKAEI